jgi:ADP-ribose pyrophosphatase
MRKTLHEGRFIRLVDDDGWEFADRVGATGVVCIAAVDEEHIILVEEFRSAVQRPVISLPAGLIDQAPAGRVQEGAIEAALRELREETGYTARRIEEAVSGPISAGMSTERLTFFVAQDLTPGAQALDGDEHIKVHRVPVRRLPEWLAAQVARGVDVDPKIFVGLYFVRRRGLVTERARWWDDWRARVTAMKRNTARRGDGALSRIAEDDAMQQIVSQAPAARTSTDDALARLGKVLNWLGLTVALISGVWVLVFVASLLGAFGSYTDTISTALLAIGGAVVGFLAWISGRAALYVLAGR